MISSELGVCLKRRSFSHWYQTMMMESHVHLVTTLLLTVAVMALVEVIFEQGLGVATRMAWLCLLSLAALFTIYCLRNYFVFMMWAERVAHQATCMGCGTYGRLRLVRQTQRHCAVACKRCANEWMIEEPEIGWTI